MRLGISLVLAICLVGWLSQPAGAVIVQNGANFVAWEADYDVTITDPDGGGTWEPYNDALASQGVALTSNILPEPNNGTDRGDATYTLQFTAAGTYKLYIRAENRDLNGNGDLSENDSVYSPTDFGVPGLNRFNMYAYDRTPPIPIPSPRLGWTWNDNAVIPASGGGAKTYVVTAAMVGQNLSFTIGLRDSGTCMDKIVLSQVTDLTPAGLDALPAVPEPATLSLLLLGGLLGMRRRR
jgi:hypothetical protein